MHKISKAVTLYWSAPIEYVSYDVVDSLQYLEYSRHTVPKAQLFPTEIVRFCHTSCLITEYAYVMQFVEHRAQYCLGTTCILLKHHPM